MSVLQTSQLAEVLPGVIPKIAADLQTFIDIRRHIHAHPELGSNVANTAELVAGMLRQWGYEVHTCIGGEGVVAQLKVGNGVGKIGIRADMDALPIHEQTQLPYASRISGKMHACGHDGHTAILLAAAKYIAESRSFNGTVNLIFQPDEEGLCGAKRMMEDGLFERFPCDWVYALHNTPGVPVGKALIKSGGVSFASDVATITLRGVGGHGAMPEKTCDPIVAAGSLIMALQTIVSRNIAPLETGVVSIGGIHAGATHNVIPETVELLLNMRSSDAAVRQRIETRIHEIVTLQSQSYGVDAQIDYKRLVPVVVNAQAPTALAHEVMGSLVGSTNVLSEITGAMGSEDFAWMSEQIPGCYVFLGNGVGEWGGCMVHNPKYDFNDNIIGLGASFWVRLVEAYLR